MGQITNDWLSALSEEFLMLQLMDLYRFVKNEYMNYVIYPKAEDIFNAFHLTPLNQVKVVILGQDPIIMKVRLMVFVFRFNPTLQFPSLVNIYKELQDDLGLLHTR